MSWQTVLRRDLTSVYRSRTGTAVAAIIALATVVATDLFALNSSLTALAGVAGLLAVGAVVALVFLGTPRQMAIVVGLFSLLAIALTLLLREPSPRFDARPEMQLAVVTTGSLLSFLLPLVALIGSYAALVGERETGSIRFLLGLPNTRTDAFVGKFLSRALVVCVPLVAGVLLSGVIVALTFKNGSFLGMLGVTLVSIPYALLFVGIGLSASAYADSSNRSVAAVIAAFVLFRAGWPAVQFIGLQSMEDAYPRPEWYFWLGRVNPINAYVRLTESFGTFEYGHPLLTRPDETLQTVALSTEFAAVVLLAWTAVAPLAGYLYYKRRDLL